MCILQFHDQLTLLRMLVSFVIRGNADWPKADNNFAHVLDL